MFKESDIQGEVEFLVDGRVALIPLLICRITKENALDSMGIKFTAVMLVNEDNEQPKL